MIEIRYLQAESGANKFGTCNCCGKSSSEDPLMISIKFSYYGHGTLICLCDDCKKKLMEALPPAQPQIIYCKDCAKHNKRLGDYEIRLLDGKTKWIGTDKACPLVAIRGKAQGHEFDYQFCAFAERRTDEQTKD